MSVRPRAILGSGPSVLKVVLGLVSECTSRAEQRLLDRVAHTFTGGQQVASVERDDSRFGSLRRLGKHVRQAGLADAPEPWRNSTTNGTASASKQARDSSISAARPTYRCRRRDDRTSPSRDGRTVSGTTPG